MPTTIIWVSEQSSILFVYYLFAWLFGLAPSISGLQELNKQHRYGSRLGHQRPRVIERPVSGKFRSWRPQGTPHAKKNIFFWALRGEVIWAMPKENILFCMRCSLSCLAPIQAAKKRGPVHHQQQFFQSSQLAYYKKRCGY